VLEAKKDGMKEHVNQPPVRKGRKGRNIRKIMRNKDRIEEDMNSPRR
jgi:hypothetical protein